jgi:hypothetical protein
MLTPNAKRLNALEKGIREELRLTMFSAVSHFFTGLFHSPTRPAAKRDNSMLVGIAQIERMSNQELLDTLSRPVHTVNLKINNFKPTYSAGMQVSPFASNRLKRK